MAEAETHPPVSPVSPYLICAGASDAIEFYKRAFGAEELFRLPASDGKLMHACMRINGATVMLTGTYELHKWEPRKVVLTFHGERLQGRYSLFQAGRSEKEVVAANLERRIVAPALRMADSDDQGLKLSPALGLGGRRKPVDALQAPVERCLDVVDHVADVGLGALGQIFVDVELAERVAEIAV